MLMCSRCHQRPAVVFISQINPNKPEEKKNEGLCLVCAKELGLPQVDDYIKSMGISEDELTAMSEQLAEVPDGDDFELGGSGTMPDFLTSLFGEMGKAGGLLNNLAGELSKSAEQAEAAKDGAKSVKEDKKDKKKKLKFLDNYCTNLTQRARDGELDRIIGRDKEIARVIHILSRRQKNNPCLIGEPGVGKTAVAEGIAQKIVGGDVPFHLQDKEVYLLDLTALVAGTQFRGQFESRCKGLVEEVKKQGNIILFIDEVHSLVGTGDSEGTTALERRFQPVTVGEPTIEQTVEVLKGIKGYYENFHRVKISDEKLRECAELSERYINDRFLPDKAIDLLDEACACASIDTPELGELDKLNRELKKHKDLVSEYEEKSDPDYEILATEKAEISRIENRLKEVEEKVRNVQVTDADISKVIELWTGIPANKISQSEFEKIKSLKTELSKRVIGQDEAVEKVANAIRRTRVQLSKRRRPASFIFVGPTGVGKTELVKVLGETLFDATEPLIRVDMSEYMERHSVSKLIGSPPGYVGFDEAGQLTEKVRRRPYSVVLFDEIEKAHPDVMNILLQILDEGTIHDSQGRDVNFENTVIVMTSNAGSTDKDTGVGFNKTDNEIAHDKAIKALREFLRPEFIGRVDEVVVFNRLTQQDYAKIADLMLSEIAQPLEERGIKLRYNEDVLNVIAHKSYDQKLGARDIRRVIRNEIEDRISEFIVDRNNTGITAFGISTADDEIKVECL